jgi:hypothetical protein
MAGDICICTCFAATSCRLLVLLGMCKHARTWTSLRIVARAASTPYVVSIACTSLHAIASTSSSVCCSHTPGKLMPSACRRRGPPGRSGSSRCTCGWIGRARFQTPEYEFKHRLKSGSDAITTGCAHSLVRTHAGHVHQRRRYAWEGQKLHPVRGERG